MEKRPQLVGSHSWPGGSHWLWFGGKSTFNKVDYLKKTEISSVYLSGTLVTPRESVTTTSPTHRSEWWQFYSQRADLSDTGLSNLLSTKPCLFCRKPCDNGRLQRGTIPRFTSGPTLSSSENHVSIELISALPLFDFS
jgi:hypothetical protein